MYYNLSALFFRKSKPVARGFGLLELLVSISIIVLVSSIILTRQSSFNGAVLLRNQTYEIAFALRQAQLQAVSGTDGGNSTQQQQYGIYFTTASRNSYLIFKDINANGIYDSGTDTQVGPISRIDPRFELRGITNLGGTSLGGSMSITFRRPNFDALFSIGNGPVYIDIAKVGDSTNGAGSVRRVEVSSAGQISVTIY
jgi:prepilin-type N-terminal cleavage/methylation domain-containing protein